MRSRKLNDVVPDVRDGLTHPERIVLWCLSEAQKRNGGRNVPTAMLYGHVVEHLDIGQDEFQRILQRLGAGSPQGGQWGARSRE